MEVLIINHSNYIICEPGGGNINEGGEVDYDD